MKLCIAEGLNFGPKIGFSTMTLFQLIRHSLLSSLWWILHYDTVPAHKVLSEKQLLAQKSITELEHPPHSHSPDLAPNDF